MSLNPIADLQMIANMAKYLSQSLYRLIRSFFQSAEMKNFVESSEMPEEPALLNFDMLERVVVFADAETSKRLRLTCKTMNRFFNLYRIKQGVSADDETVIMARQLHVQFNGPDEEIFVALQREPDDEYIFHTVGTEALYNHIWYIFSANVEVEWLDPDDFVKFHRTYFHNFRNRNAETCLSFKLSLKSPDVHRILMELAMPRNIAAKRFHALIGKSAFHAAFLSDDGYKSYHCDLLDLSTAVDPAPNEMLVFFQSDPSFFEKWMEAIMLRCENNAVFIFAHNAFDDIENLFMHLVRSKKFTRVGYYMSEANGSIYRFGVLLSQEKKMLYFGSLVNPTDEAVRLFRALANAQADSDDDESVSNNGDADDESVSNNGDANDELLESDDDWPVEM